VTGVDTVDIQLFNLVNVISFSCSILFGNH
jgi:hypothetical protein